MRICPLGSVAAAMTLPLAPAPPVLNDVSRAPSALMRTTFVAIVAPRTLEMKPPASTLPPGKDTMAPRRKKDDRKVNAVPGSSAPDEVRRTNPQRGVPPKLLKFPVTSRCPSGCAVTQVAPDQESVADVAKVPSIAPEGA